MNFPGCDIPPRSTNRPAGPEPRRRANPAGRLPVQHPGQGVVPLCIALLIAVTGCGDKGGGGSGTGGAKGELRAAAPPEFDPPLDAGFGTESVDDPRPQALPRSFCTWKGRRIVLEVADTHARRRKGMMFRTGLPQEPDPTAMLFLYPEPQVGAYYWNRNVPLALDMAFCGPDGKVVARRRMEALSPDSVGTEARVAFVLEMPGGVMDRLGIKEGDVIELSDLLRKHRAPN